MHIAEGILPITWAAANAAIAVPFIAKGVAEIRARAKKDPTIRPMIGLIGAAIFVISALPIPVPITGTSAHPTGVGLAAILIGPFPTAAVTLVVLALQALFMAHGGLTSLGANTLNMGVIGALSGLAVFWLARRLGLSAWIGAAAAGFVGDLSTYAGTALSMSLALHGDSPVWSVWSSIALAFVPTQIPLAFLEAALTAGVLSYVASRRPDMIARLCVGSSGALGGSRSAAMRWGIAAAAILLGLVVFSLLRGSQWEGVDVAVVGSFATQLGRPPSDPLLNIQGDFLLFAFAFGGAIGGFVLGYFWRGLGDRRSETENRVGARFIAPSPGAANVVATYSSAGSAESRPTEVGKPW
ncbi:MAG: energy-coupling factor ABC transporter permease [Chloroflexota bacterium]|nr:MAG: energy-coupling factor ABC transporter permease [Chloroflexota bacterium]